mgnify:CR=1 FL=1
MQIMPINNSITNTNFRNRVVTKSVKKATLNQTKKLEKPVIVLTSVALAEKIINKAVKNDNFQIKELTQEEFEQKCKEIKKAHEEAHDEWLKFKENYDKNEISYSEWTFPSFAFIDDDRLTQWNVQLLDYMLKHPETYKYNYNDLAEDIVELGNGNNQKSAKVVLKMLKMPYLFPQEHNTKKHFGLNGYMYEKEYADTKLKILDMIEKNETNYDRAQIYNLRNILTWIKTDDGLRVAKKLIEKPDILKAWIHENAFRYYSNEKEDGGIKIAFADKINSKPELLKDKKFIKFVGDNFNNITDKHTLDFACKLLDNPILFESESFCKLAKTMIYEYPEHDNDTDIATREVMNKIVDAVVKRPELFKNLKFKDDFGELLFVRKGPQDETWFGERVIETGKRNLFLIENGYYDTQQAE